MSAKITATRRAAFLKALAETGNQTLSAERAKVLRSWVLLHRRRDPGFDAAVREAVEKAGQSFDRLRTSGEGAGRPPSGWGHLDGVELVVRGSGGSGKGRRVQIARARLHQWDARVEERFLAALRATCNVKAACAEVGMSAASAYNHRKRWRAFSERWDAAVAEGYARIEIALVETGANLFSADDGATEAGMAAAEGELGPGEGGDDPDVRVLSMTADHAIHMLHMHKHQVHGIGRAPGQRWRPRPSLDDPAIRASIMRKVEAIKNSAGVSEAERERDRREWALRRGGAGG